MMEENTQVKLFFWFLTDFYDVLFCFCTYHMLGLPGGTGEAYGPTFGPGDVIGVGLDNASNNIFFTKNGRYLGIYLLYYSLSFIFSLFIYMLTSSLGFKLIWFFLFPFIL